MSLVNFIARILSDEDLEIKKDSSIFSDLFKKIALSSEEIKQLSEEELTKLVERLILEFEDVLADRRLLEEEVKRLKEREAELNKQILEIYKATKKELWETDNLLIKLKESVKWGTPRYKELLAMALPHLSEELKKSIQDAIDEMKIAGAREKVLPRVYPKKQSQKIIDPYWYAEKKIQEMLEAGYPRREAWRRIVAWFGDKVDLIELQEIFEDYYGSLEYEANRRRADWKEKIKEWGRKIYDVLARLVNRVRNINSELRDLLNMADV